MAALISWRVPLKGGDKAPLKGVGVDVYIYIYGRLRADPCKSYVAVSINVGPFERELSQDSLRGVSWVPFGLI